MTQQQHDRSADCAHCDSEIVPDPRGGPIWVHRMTRLPRCVDTAEVCVAVPAEPGPFDEEFWA